MKIMRLPPAAAKWMQWRGKEMELDEKVKNCLVKIV
jgi:hypothetical protein